MSAPSTAWFIKNGLVVGLASINIGWSYSGSGFLRCMWEGWHQAKSFFDNQPFTKQQLDSRWYKEFSPYFTTREELLAFDHVYIYGNIVPRDVYEALHRNPDCTPQIIQLINSGLFDDSADEFKTAVAATKIARGID